VAINGGNLQEPSKTSALVTGINKQTHQYKQTSIKGTPGQDDATPGTQARINTGMYTEVMTRYGHKWHLDGNKIPQIRKTLMPKRPEIMSAVGGVWRDV